MILRPRYLGCLSPASLTIGADHDRADAEADGLAVRSVLLTHLNLPQNEGQPLSVPARETLEPIGQGSRSAVGPTCVSVPDRD